MSRDSYSEAVVIVTGYGRGVGRVTAKMFAARGARVTVADKNGAGAQRVAEEITGDGGQAIWTKTDVSSEGDVAQMVAETERRHGGVDVLVNNAAICVADGVLSTSRVDWDAEMAVVLTGPFLCTKAVLPGMIERHGGAIVNISSMNGLRWAGNEAYSAAKAGVISLTRSVGSRYGRFGVRANAVIPGSIQTEAWTELVANTPDVFETIEKWFPLGRVGQPEDIARAVMFLASDDAAWITGTTLIVDGGASAGDDLLNREFLGEVKLEIRPGPAFGRDSALATVPDSATPD
jgi:meso-butanediol dehydrogenase / (S,S)-butanediol dehydrogenase / diacetyl reductase